MQYLTDGIIVVQVHNLADDGVKVAEFETRDIPRVGELVCTSPHYLAKGSASHEAFATQYFWRVDQVLYQVASPVSMAVREYVESIRGGRTLRGGMMSWVELFCWPAQGPHWATTPSWAPSSKEED